MEPRACTYPLALALGKREGNEGSLNIREYRYKVRTFYSAFSLSIPTAYAFGCIQFSLVCETL
jgi:hypothetical protein